ncbi:MAG: dTDP-4-dehydrorhamnose reductase [Cellvibrionaceae bacterium]|nr:dTDP-4-dehydrorhamnose reductase [Cellvibrionaceae bacterium]
MRILVVGKSGQLAWELGRSIPAGWQVTTRGHDELDIRSAEQIREHIARYDPQVVINCAAYTAVDKAESDSATAYAVNESGVRNLALACRDHNVRLFHISTDFVFDGRANQPYAPDAVANPLSVYGASKWAGEQLVSQLLPQSSVIVRTSWVYSSHGNNFVKTILRLVKEKPQIGVVADQIGSPTWAKGLADWLWAIAAKPDISGVFHWSDAGVASWYDFAVAIQELGYEKGLLGKTVPINPIPTTAYPVPACRPKYSVLDKRSAENAAGIKSVHWRQQLARMLDELK